MGRRCAHLRAIDIRLFKVVVLIVFNIVNRESIMRNPRSGNRTVTDLVRMPLISPERRYSRSVRPCRCISIYERHMMAASWEAHDCYRAIRRLVTSGRPPPSRKAIRAGTVIAAKSCTGQTPIHKCRTIGEIVRALSPQ